MSAVDRQRPRPAWLRVVRPSVAIGDLTAHVWAGVHGLATLWGTAVFEGAFHGEGDEAVRRLVGLLLDDA